MPATVSRGYHAADGQPAGDLISFLRGLRAIREYTPEPVAQGALDDIVEVGR